MLDVLLTPAFWAALATLTLIEIVLGIDNIIFISIVTARLPVAHRSLARKVGLMAASITRIALLLFLVWVKHFTKPLITLWGFSITGQTIVLIGGGLFLIAKSSMEIHDILEVPEEEMHANPKKAFFMVILQIMVLDIVFSLDSIITAIGLVNYIPVMILAILTAIFFMVFLSDVITYVLNRHPSIKMLALSFLLMIGLMLVLQGVGINVPKEYIYGAMAFSVFVESLNIMVRRKRKKRQHVKHPHHIKKDHE